VEIYDLFPKKCRTVLEALKVFNCNDAIARREDMSPEARLLFHQA
jgi:hypothetical protein